MQRTQRECVTLLFCLLLLTQGFAQANLSQIAGSHRITSTTVTAVKKHPRMVRNAEIEAPGTGRTIHDLIAAGYYQRELSFWVNQEIVPGAGMTVADAISRGWSDTDVENFISRQTPPQTQPPTSPQTQPNAQTPPTPPAAPVSTDSKPPDILDGTLSAGGDLQDDEAPRTSFFRRPTSLDRWFAWKRQLQESHGLNFGGSWGVLWQNYTNSAIAQPNSVGSKFTFNWSYDLFNHRKPSAFSFDMAIEDRRPLGTNLPPLQAGIGAGSIVPTAATWGMFDLGITQAYIRQNLFANHFQYTVGKIFAPNFIDAYPFFDDNRQFLSQQFSTSPTIASPLRGFGAVGAWFPTKSGMYLKSGMFTSLSSDTGSTISNFFTKNEHFYFWEGGVSGLARSGIPVQARGPMDANNIHVTGWYRNPTNGTPQSYGIAGNANRMIGSQYMWFVRSGWSVGYINNWALSGGLGWRPAKTTADLFGAAFGWTRPTVPVPGGLRSQYTAETFYRFHVTPNFAITPDFQLIQHPALNPRVDTMWVTSVRARVVF